MARRVYSGRRKGPSYRGRLARRTISHRSLKENTRLPALEVFRKNCLEIEVGSPAKIRIVVGWGRGTTSVVFMGVMELKIVNQVGNERDTDSGCVLRKQFTEGKLSDEGVKKVPKIIGSLGPVRKLVKMEQVPAAFMGRWKGQGWPREAPRLESSKLMFFLQRVLFLPFLLSNPHLLRDNALQSEIPDTEALSDPPKPFLNLSSDLGIPLLLHFFPLRIGCSRGLNEQEACVRKFRSDLPIAYVRAASSSFFLWSSACTPGMSCTWLVKGRKKGYMVSDPDDIGTVRLVGWLMMVSCPNSVNIFLFLLLLGSRLVCELGPVLIPKAHREGCGASLSMLLPLPVRWLPLSPLIWMLPLRLRSERHRSRVGQNLRLSPIVPSSFVPDPKSGFASYSDEMSVPFVQPALAYASYSSYKNLFHYLNGTPKRLDKVDPWEDVEAGLESIPSAPGTIRGQSVRGKGRPLTINRRSISHRRPDIALFEILIQEKRRATCQQKERKKQKLSHVVTHIICTLRKPVSAAQLEEILSEKQMRSSSSKSVAGSGSGCGV
ncbi:hypothetical protein GOBAR_DD34897 [Gossypium barbadense]|nr:hypothetical protein GOBAR_DD34897 [Gossypium barbadense]